ncbi:hypothetical protein BU26DRAFT_561242 [Trematosphaeria pertusa]|uniref:Uncharacterized protein n=1 Tax=Trematosphaeria pertusa TaxID=390896 RepID=A0A6A6IWI8_9PLEO|nr:uncharacterized protein BU26DRAFT_561242 [Trematosphaeria pertusa]KAF2253980.1 hypothetical protein BU26DRAFT_561242 [Trematosphaeria pertusa]
MADANLVLGIDLTEGVFHIGDDEDKNEHREDAEENEEEEEESEEEHGDEADEQEEPAAEPHIFQENDMPPPSTIPTQSSTSRPNPWTQPTDTTQPTAMPSPTTALALDAILQSYLPRAPYRVKYRCANISPRQRINKKGQLVVVMDRWGRIPACEAEFYLRENEPLRCKECGSWGVYKVRTTRMVQFEAR